MVLTNAQTELLNQPINPKLIKTRKGSYDRESGDFKKLAYLESWVLMSNANRIFGHDGWSSKTLELREVPAKDPQGKGFVSYIARVEITAANVVRVGTGGATSNDHENAAKSAESDARKRALSSFGDQFGLSLYDGEQGQSSTALLKSSINTHTQQLKEDTKGAQPLDPAFIDVYLHDLKRWAQEYPDKFENVKSEYKRKFPDFSGVFSSHVQEIEHINLIDQIAGDSFCIHYNSQKKRS